MNMESVMAVIRSFEHRREDRTKLLFAPLLLGMEGRVLARVVDLSLHGAQLYARRGLFTQGEVISGWLQSPPVGEEDEIFLAVGLTVRWTSEDHQAGWTCIGCELDPMDEQSNETLERLIMSLAP
jgi:hypothetical protein